MSAPAAKEFRYVVCIGNERWPASLEVRKIYRALPDAQAEQHGMIRVIDESGEDYLYPAQCFVPIKPPSQVVGTFAAAG
jgi:hypothetical protein